MQLWFIFTLWSILIDCKFNFYSPSSAFCFWYKIKQIPTPGSQHRHVKECNQKQNTKWMNRDKLHIPPVGQTKLWPVRTHKAETGCCLFSYVWVKKKKGVEKDFSLTECKNRSSDSCFNPTAAVTDSKILSCNAVGENNHCAVTSVSNMSAQSESNKTSGKRFGKCNND